LKKEKKVADFQTLSKYLAAGNETKEIWTNYSSRCSPAHPANHHTYYKYRPVLDILWAIRDNNEVD
jgi:hypothetical protein